MSDTIGQLGRVFDEAVRLASAKNADYGDAWRDQGWRGNLSRVLEKAKRLKTLLWKANGNDPRVAETTRETALDMINTLAFFIINQDAGMEWGNEEYHGQELTQSFYGGVGPDQIRIDRIEQFHQATGAPDQTQTMHNVGELPPSGSEDAPSNQGRKPSPTQRKRVVKEAPQG